MTVFLQKRAPKMALGVTSYGILKFLGMPSNASKVASMAIFSYAADNVDLEFVTPLLLTPIVQNRIRSPMISTGIYSLSMGYITWNWCFDHLSVPKNLRRFLDNNCGMDRQSLSWFRAECSERGWPTREMASTQDQRVIMIRCIKSLVVSIGKLEALSSILKMVLSRNLKINVRDHAEAWMRTIIFCFVIMQISVQGPTMYSKHKTNGEGENPPIPNKAVLQSFFTLSACIGIQVLSKSNQKVLASCLFFQAMITLLNRRGIEMKTIAPFICFLCAQRQR